MLSTSLIIALRSFCIPSTPAIIGQFIIVVPSLDIVIVRTGDDRDERLDLNTLIPLCLEVAK